MRVQNLLINMNMSSPYSNCSSIARQIFCMPLYQATEVLSSSKCLNVKTHLAGIWCSSRHIPGVRFPGLIHPGLIGTAPSQQLLDIWNERERKLVADGPEALTLGGCLHTRPMGTLLKPSIMLWSALLLAFRQGQKRVLNACCTTLLFPLEAFCEGR